MIPKRLLVLLTALVLALHALLLSGASAGVRRAAGTAPPVFVTRTLSAPVPVQTAPAPVTRAAPRRPTTLSTAPTARRNKAPAPAPAPVAAPPVPVAPVWVAPSDSELLALDAAGGEQAPAVAAEPQEAPTPPPGRPDGERPAAAAPTPAPASAPERSAPADADVAPVKLPPPARLRFDVTGKARGFGYNAHAELLWQHDATSYSAHQEVKVIFLGSRSQSSVGSVTERGLQPRRFGDRSRSERAAHFDFAKGQVTFSANTPAAPIEPGAQDRLSVFLQLASMLAAAPERYPTGAQIAMTTVSARAADVWTFTVEGEDTLELPAGTMRTVQLQRLPRRDYDQKAQLWLAPALGYLPARIRITEANGDFVELNLSEHEAP